MPDGDPLTSLPDPPDEHREALLADLSRQESVVANSPESGEIRAQDELAPCPNGECDGTGRIVDRIPESNEWHAFGDGMQIRQGGGYSSRLCSCRKVLPKRDGRASWWGSSEQVFEDTVEFAMFDEYATLSVGVETCITEDNYLVHRTAENAYYPPISHLEVSDTDLTWLLPDDLRKLAAMLLAAADKCDEIEAAAT